MAALISVFNHNPRNLLPLLLKYFGNLFWSFFPLKVTGQLFDTIDIKLVSVVFKFRILCKLKEGYQKRDKSEIRELLDVVQISPFVNIQFQHIPKLPSVQLVSTKFIST